MVVDECAIVVRIDSLDCKREPKKRLLQPRKDKPLQSVSHRFGLRPRRTHIRRIQGVSVVPSCIAPFVTYQIDFDEARALFIPITECSDWDLVLE